MRRLQNTGETGLETKSTGLRTGRNSGYQAVNLAVHYGASRILLLGYDMQMVEGRRHFFGNHPESGHHSPYPSFRQHFATVVKPLAQAGVTVVNCTPGSALTCFPTDALRQALPVSAEVAA